jgi:hypothetical protein
VKDKRVIKQVESREGSRMILQFRALNLNLEMQPVLKPVILSVQQHKQAIRLPDPEPALVQALINLEEALVQVVQALNQALNQALEAQVQALARAQVQVRVQVRVQVQAQVPVLEVPATPHNLKDPKPKLVIKQQRRKPGQVLNQELALDLNQEQDLDQVAPGLDQVVLDLVLNLEHQEQQPGLNKVQVHNQ